MYFNLPKFFSREKKVFLFPASDSRSNFCKARDVPSSVLARKVRSQAINILCRISTVNKSTTTFHISDHH
ncbi:unnamed protein product [Allacma fusca]|uniref:Uncharacterized protein n=1 Tax=Allacma fusca TaxID=39272 RepID=A0A8J2JW75_9HEXA|nr:unnamed protein product [Allacma fusca]